MPDCIMTGEDLARRCADIAANRKTIYMYACYGFQVTDAAIRSKAAQNLNGWYTSARIAHLKEKANQTPPVWGFDCVNLIKGILWGWTGDETKEKGGAKYATNGVPDTNADGMIARCSDVSTDFREIAVGEAIWMKGHIGVYIGQGLCVECTPKWADGVQITAVWNIGKQAGYNGRTWTKHGKLPWIDYGEGGTLRKGSKGERVKALQERLMLLGYDLGKWGADGDFGERTMAAVGLFQGARGLSVTGAADEGTISALMEAGYTVTVRGVSYETARELLSRYPGSEAVIA